MWILRINMKDRTYKLEDVPQTYKFLGGRALTSAIVSDEVPPTCHPLGPNNKLIFAAGVVTGTSAPTSARVSVGGKSPLTGTIKESNAGSKWGPDLASLRVKAMIVEGQPEDTDKAWTALLSWGGERPKVEFSDASQYVGKDLYEVFPTIFDSYGKVSVAGIVVAMALYAAAGYEVIGPSADSIAGTLVLVCLGIFGLASPITTYGDIISHLSPPPQNRNGPQDLLP